MRMIPALAFALACTGGEATALDAPSIQPAWACPMGALVGAHGLAAKVAAGTYEASANFTQAKYPTMEIYATRTDRGRSRLNLGADGSVDACFGATSQQHTSVSQYASPDGKPHDNRSDTAHLIGLRGRWQAAADGVRVALDTMSYGSCAADAAFTPMGAPWELVCATLSALALPVSTLACRSLSSGMPDLETLGLDLGASTRAGPWSLREDPMGHGGGTAPPCGPWLLFGATPGLTVKSEDGARQGTPTLTWTAGVPEFTDAEWSESARK